MLNAKRIQSAVSKLVAATLLTLAATAFAGQSAPEDPTKASHAGSAFRLENQSVEATITVSGNQISRLRIKDKLNGEEYSLDKPFQVLLKDGTLYSTGTMLITHEPELKELTPRNGASRLAESIHGEEIRIPLESRDHSVRMDWEVILRDGSHYLRQTLSITAAEKDLPIERVQLIDFRLPGAHVAGVVDGSPIISTHVFAGFEHPLSRSRVTGDRATVWLSRQLPLQKGQPITYSAVVGFARPGQLRRDFLAYLERERAHPYRTFLHYNSWFDLGFGNNYTADGGVDRVRAFATELQQKRGAKLDSFLFDDGWDNHASLWKFNEGFPNGFSPVAQEASKYGTHIGVWMSPWGGYAKAKQERIAFGKSAGYEIVNGGYALSGPKYYAAFRDVCMEMMQKYGVNQFKFDGTGNVNSVFPGSEFDSDFSAAIHLISELREAKPDVFINLTTGTWPSPFWLMYADSIWRGGDDDNATGVGPYRERWITYRDAQTYQNIVQNGPLYPLNSLMLHGIIFAQQHPHLNTDPQNDFRNEVRSYFGSGTQLQEMYITPKLLSSANWDDLAEAAKWSRANAHILKDTHWVGGNPALLEVYGWAAWSPEKAVLVLRNPSDQAQSLSIKLQDALELPEGAPLQYTASSPWRSEARQDKLELDATREHAFRLAPFEVLTLDLLPRNAPR